MGPSNNVNPNQQRRSFQMHSSQKLYLQSKFNIHNPSVIRDIKICQSHVTHTNIIINSWGEQYVIPSKCCLFCPNFIATVYPWLEIVTFIRATLPCNNDITSNLDGGPSGVLSKKSTCFQKFNDCNLFIAEEFFFKSFEHIIMKSSQSGAKPYEILFKKCKFCPNIMIVACP